MDKFTFISSVIGHISWPIASVTTVFLFRKIIYLVLPNMKRLKVKDLEVEFHEVLQSIQNEINTPEGKPSWEVTKTNHLQPNMLQLSEKSPLAVVLQAWDILESSVISCTEKISNKTFNNSSQAIEWLDSQGKLLSGYKNIYYRLMALKTKFSSFENEKLPKERALEYADTALSVAKGIEVFASL